MITYHQSTGRTEMKGLAVYGYSGHGDAKNDGSREAERSVGPIPRGLYAVSAPFDHPLKGPLCFHLTPVRHNAHGRSGFLIHGDSRIHPGDASEGCIILGHTVRERIADLHETQLEVLP